MKPPSDSPSTHYEELLADPVSELKKGFPMLKGDPTAGRNEIGSRVAIHAHAHPQLQIQKAPDAIPVIVSAAPMLGKNAFHHLVAEEPSLQSSGSRQQALQVIKLGSRKPICPRRWE